MDNKDILSESFFKKTTYAEKRKSKLPQYTPIDISKEKDTLNTGVPSYLSNVPAYEVSDTREVKKRLANTFGVAFGNNSVKSLASRALKTFPIFVSDNVEPETVVMLKKLMEEQYAEYINLLISSQVVDLSAYRSGDGGNIALQALDQLSGNEFGKAALADKVARRDGFDPNDIFQNIPLYNLLRENQIYVDDKSILGQLLENAIILPSDKADTLVEFIQNNYDDIVSLNESASDTAALKGADYSVVPAGRTMTGRARSYSPEDSDIANLNRKLAYTQNLANLKYEEDRLNDITRGSAGIDSKGNEILKKVSSADIVLDKDKLDIAVNRSVGEILSDPQNFVIRDRFEKATFLLQSRRISGKEYYQYLVIRLGIPVSDKARLRLVSEYRTSQVRDYTNGVKSGDAKGDFLIRNEDRVNIEKNRRVSDKIVRSIWNTKIKDALMYTGAAVAGAGAGLATAYGTGALVAGSLSLAALGPVGWTILAACAVGGAGIAATIAHRVSKKLKAKYVESNKIEGWERVEALIEMMDKNQAEVTKSYTAHRTASLSKIDSTDDRNVNNIGLSKYSGSSSQASKDSNGVLPEADSVSFSDYYRDYANTLRRSLGEKELSDNEIGQLKKKSTALKLNLREDVEEKDTFNYDNETISVLKEQQELADEVINEMFNDDPSFRKEILSEKLLGKYKEPVTVKYVDKKPDKDVLIVPTEYSKSVYNYGSAEIDRKANRDRRYNEPLIMTIKFKGRYDDPKISDSALTAVIGILGKVVRIPSNEMEYILKSNAEGSEGVGSLLSKAASGDLKNIIGDMISSSKLKDNDKLPQSGETWRNLEKVATLAATNTMSGRKNDNLANAHIIFSTREYDNVKNDTGIDYLRDAKKTAALMKKYSAFTIMIANDAGQRVYIFDDLDSISWNVVPYSALAGKDTGDQLNAMLNKMTRL